MSEDSPGMAGLVVESRTPSVYEERPVRSGSLEARMQERQEKLAHLSTEIFPVPRWEDMLAVELRLVGWKRLNAIIDKHENVRDTGSQRLYVAVDQLVLATVGFHEVKPGVDGDELTPKEDATWVKLARAANPKLPDSITPRQALIALVGDTQAIFLWNEWLGWARGARPKVDDQLERDFDRTD
jgi:hypothetical protein